MLAGLRSAADRSTSREVVRAAGDSAVLRRTLLQWIVPDLVKELNWQRATYRAAGLRFDPEEWAQAVLIAGWETVRAQAGRERNWPLLSLRTELRRRTRQTRERDWGWRDHAYLVGLDGDCDQLDLGASVATAHLELERAVSMGVIDRGDCALIELTRVHGFTATEIAKSLGVGYGVVIRRRRRAEARLAEFPGLAALAS